MSDHPEGQDYGGLYTGVYIEVEYHRTNFTVTLSPSSAELVVGGTQKLTAEVEPENAADKTVKWSVNNSNVKLYTDEACTTEVGADATTAPTVYAKGISAGSATVTATSNADSTKSASCDMTVVKPANPATVTSTATVIKGGNTVDLSTLVSLNGATGDVTYTIDGETNGCTLNGSILKSGDNTGTVTVNVTVTEDDTYSALAATPITVTIIDKKTQIITAENITVTYGDTGKSVSVSLTEGNGTLSYAVKEGDAVTVDANGALTILHVGTADVTVTASETQTYAKAEKVVTITVEKKPLTIKAKDQSIYVGGAVPTLSGAGLYTVTGLVGEDTLTTAPTLTYKKDGSAADPDNTKAGTYDIVPDGASASDNYTISYQNGKLTVEDLTFYTAEGDDQKYKKSDLTFTFKMKGDDANTFKYKENFKKATIKGPGIDRALNSDEYTAENGSLKLTVKNSLLKTLKAGTYTVTVYFIDEAAAHSASATFTIPSADSGTTPGTGEDTKMNLIVSAMILFLLSLSFIAHMAYTDRIFRAKLLAVPAGISSFLNGKAAADVSAPDNAGVADTVIDESENIVLYEAASESASVSDSFDDDIETEDIDDSFDEDLETEDIDGSFDGLDDSCDTDEELDPDSADSYSDLEAKLNELEAKLTGIEDAFNL